MRPSNRVLLSCLAVSLVACGTDPGRPTDVPVDEDAAVSFLSVIPGYIETIAVSITGPGIGTPLVFNLTVDPTTHVASGTVSVPVGNNRRFVANAFDSAGTNTHRGECTVNLAEGNNPTVSLVMAPLNGDVDIEVSFGTAVLVLTPEVAVATVGDTVTFTFAGTDGLGDPITEVVWGLGNPAVAGYAGEGKVVAQTAGVSTVTVNTPYGSVQATLTVVPALTGVIIYERDAGNNPQLHPMLPDGSGAQRLPTGLANDIHGTWGPGRAKVAFSDWPVGNVFVMDADGSNRVQLTTSGSADYSPQISPDGARIVWARQVGGGDAGLEICTMNIDGSDVACLTDDATADRWPRWSPDGGRIFFESERDGAPEIYAMNADGTEPVRLTNSLGSNTRPVPSPDGMKVLFTSTRDGDFEVYAMNADGANPVRLTTDAAEDIAGAWSPDGSYVAFTSNRSGVHAVHLLALAGGGPLRITNSPVWEGNVDWR